MALYNGGFPASYQPIYYQQPQMPQAAYSAQAPLPQAPTGQPQGGNNGIIWVQGEAGAKSYLVAPNTTVQLWDSEAQTIYLKSADASGMPSMKVLDYTIRDMGGTVPPVAQAQADFVTRGELEAVNEKLKSLQMEINGLISKKKAPVRLMKEDEGDE